MTLTDPSAPEGQRRAKTLLQLELATDVSVVGADDYSEVVTTSSRHLVATSLFEFEKSLDGRKFVRVHRSAIANLQHVRRGEPTGGGRMLLYLENGPDLPVSRAGAKRLRHAAL